jgi:hypothetical protein
MLNKIIAENSLNLEKEMVFQVQQAFSIQTGKVRKRTSLNHMIVKTLGRQNKERILIVARWKHHSHF